MNLKTFFLFPCLSALLVGCVMTPDDFSVSIDEENAEPTVDSDALDIHRTDSEPPTTIDAGGDSSADTDSQMDSDANSDTDTQTAVDCELQGEDGTCDECPSDPEKTAPGVCGCGEEDLIGETGAPFCLIAHWKFEGDARDEFERSHGEEMGAVTYVEGPSGLAVDLTRGTSKAKSHIRVATDAPDTVTPGLLNPDSVSLAMWIRGKAEFGRIFERGKPCMNHYGCRLEYSNLTCELNPNTEYCESIVKVSAAVDTERWQHVVFTVERSPDNTELRLRLYINGVLADSHAETGSFPNNTADQQRYLVMGRHYLNVNGGNSDLNPYYGQLDDVRIYNGPLTSKQAKALFKSY
jgi:hypothetical protein